MHYTEKQLVSKKSEDKKAKIYLSNFECEKSLYIKGFFYFSEFLKFVNSGVFVCICPRLPHFDDTCSQKRGKFTVQTDDKSHTKIPIRILDFSKLEAGLLKREAHAIAYFAVAKKVDRIIFSII